MQVGRHEVERQLSVFSVSHKNNKITYTRYVAQHNVRHAFFVPVHIAYSDVSSQVNLLIRFHAEAVRHHSPLPEIEYHSGKCESGMQQATSYVSHFRQPSLCCLSRGLFRSTVLEI